MIDVVLNVLSRPDVKAGTSGGFPNRAHWKSRKRWQQGERDSGEGGRGGAIVGRNIQILFQLETTLKGKTVAAETCKCKKA